MIKGIRLSSPVIIFSLSAIVAGGFYALAAEKYNEYSSKKAQKENQIQNILIAQQNSLNEIKKEIDLLKQKDEETRLSTTKLIISAQKIEDKINDSENETKIKEENSQRKILEIEDKISGLSNETSIVVKEWRPKMLPYTAGYGLLPTNTFSWTTMASLLQPVPSNCRKMIKPFRRRLSMGAIKLSARWTWVLLR